MTYTMPLSVPRRHPRRGGFVAALVVCALASGCSTASVSNPQPAPGDGSSTAAASAGASGAATGGATSSSPAPEVALTPNVSPDTPVAVDTVVSVSATHGSVTDVVLDYTDPKLGKVKVEGELAPDGSTWKARSLLEPATTYSMTMTGQNIDGASQTRTTTFTTVKLSKKQEINATLIANGSTVGIAMPVVVRFSAPVTDRASFEKRMHVTSVPSQPGSWAWVSNSEIHYRPASFWTPGTTVAVDIDINGVSAGNGSFGQKSVKGGFTVGYAFVMKADLAAHQMTVVKDGKVIRTIPISGGRPGMETRSGTKVIIEKNAEVIMDAATTGVPVDSPGYYRTNVKWAMRETWSGEYVHAAPWADASHGKANVSHGCIGMTTANAKWLFDLAKVGDPVVVTGTGRPLDRGNGWTDWNISFEEFRKGSALATSTAPATAGATPTKTA